jgi:predicted DCC family thiol-disulfide oxidoreductase YuxK
MNDHPIILFDGVCNFCNSTVNFVLKNDRTKKLRFAPLQSVTGEQILKLHGIEDQT